MSIYYQTRLERLRFYISENNSTAAHLHTQVELIALLEGSMLVTVDHREYTLLPGSIVIIFPNQLHSLHSAPGSRIMLCIFDGDFCHSYQKLFQNSTPESNLLPADVLSHHSALAFEGLMGLIGDYSKTGVIPKQILSLSEGYLTLLLADIFPKLSLNEKQSSPDLALEQRLLLYIDAHYTENLSLESLSREFGVNRFSLSRIFSDRLRIPFTAYVNSKRLDYARDMLVSTNDSITKIALDAGFGSSRTFFREFRRTFHAAPMEYRRIHTLSSKASYPSPTSPSLPHGHSACR